MKAADAMKVVFGPELNAEETAELDSRIDAIENVAGEQIGAAIKAVNSQNREAVHELVGRYGLRAVANAMRRRGLARYGLEPVGDDDVEVTLLDLLAESLMSTPVVFKG